MPERPLQHDPNAPAPGGTDSVIARQLTGTLKCISCGYDLHGLSIRAECPECGVPVRATILGIVDPHADELAPLSFPRMSAVGLNLWSFGALLSVSMVWALRAVELLRDMGVGTWGPAVFAWTGLVGLSGSMLGALTLIRPHRAVSAGGMARCALGVSMYFALISVYYAIYLGHDIQAPSPLFDPGGDATARSALRLLVFVLVSGIILGIRPAAVGLAVRSVIVRTGRVDRQSMLALLSALGIAALGDVLSIVSEHAPAAARDVLEIIALVVISLGSILFTVGLVNICIDTLRLYPVIRRPGVGLGDIFETNRQKSQRTGEI